MVIFPPSGGVMPLYAIKVLVFRFRLAKRLGGEGDSGQALGCESLHQPNETSLVSQVFDIKKANRESFASENVMDRHPARRLAMRSAALATLGLDLGL